MATKQWTLMDRYRDIQQRTGQSPVVQAAVYERAAKRTDGMMEFILSMPGIKRDGFDIRQDGWLLDDYRENSVVLWRHLYRNPSDIMGSCPKVWRSTAGGSPLHLRGLLQWATLEQNPQIGPVRALYEDYVLRATSVRWEDDGLDSFQEITQDELIAAKTDPAVALMWGGIRFLRARLIEWSLVPLGMDKQALSVRCQRGDLLPNQLDRFVATIKNDQLVTEDGREVLVLDGHPARFETERATTVDLGAAASADVVHADTPGAVTTTDGIGGESVAVLKSVECASTHTTYPAYADARAYQQACQRYLRGTLAGEGLDGHLVAEGKRLGLSGPESGLGLTYFDLHEALQRSEDEDERATLRTVIVQVGQKHFGDARLREAWEPRVLPEPESAWASVSSLLEVGLRAVVADGEERDALVDSLIAGLDAAIGAPLRFAERTGQPLAALSEEVGLAGVTADVVVGAVLARLKGERQEPIAPTVDVTPDPPQELPTDAQLLEIANRIETRHLGGARDDRTILEALLASLPVTDSH